MNVSRDFWGLQRVSETVLIRFSGSQGIPGGLRGAQGKED